MNDSRILTATVEAGDITHHDWLSPPAPWWSLTKMALAAGALVLVAAGRLVAIVERAVLGLP